MKTKRQFTVRKMTSGWSGETKFVVHERGKGRVTVHAHLLRDAAQADADSLEEIFNPEYFKEKNHEQV